MAPLWDLVHIITRLELGGAQLATLYEVSESRFPTGRRYLLYGPGGMLDAEAEALGNVSTQPVPHLVREVSPMRDALALTRLTVMLARIKRPRARLLVHTHSSKAGVLGRLAAAAAGADLVVHTVHGFGHHSHPAAPVRLALRTAEKLAARLTDGYTADSAANIAQGIRERILTTAPARVAYCGIDVSAFESPQRPAFQIRAELDIPDSHVVVLSLACLKPQKDPETYIRVADAVLRRGHLVTFLLAGDGVLRPRVETLIRKLGLGGRVRLLGWRRDVSDLLHASDVLTLTSRWEGLPQVFAQAMAAGKPIVATDVDGAREAIDPGVSGLLYEPGDVQGIAEGLCALITDPDRRRAMGQNGHGRVHAFGRETMLGEVDSLYADLALAKDGATRPRRGRACAVGSAETETSVPAGPPPGS